MQISRIMNYTRPKIRHLRSGLKCKISLSHLAIKIMLGWRARTCMTYRLVWRINVSGGKDEQEDEEQKRKSSIRPQEKKNPIKKNPSKNNRASVNLVLGPLRILAFGLVNTRVLLPTKMSCTIARNNSTLM